jgi:hypothetical protein
MSKQQIIIIINMDPPKLLLQKKNNIHLLVQHSLWQQTCNIYIFGEAFFVIFSFE